MARPVAFTIRQVGVRKMRSPQHAWLVHLPHSLPGLALEGGGEKPAVRRLLSPPLQGVGGAQRRVGTGFKDSQ